MENNQLIEKRTIQSSMTGIASLITSISGYRKYNMKIDTIIDSANNREKLLDDYFADLKTKGVVPSIEDLRNIDVLKGLPDITNEVVSSLVEVMKNMITLNKLDIIAKSNASSDALVYIISSNIMPNVVDKLYSGLSQMVDNNEKDVDLFDFFFDALKDIIENGPMNYDIYLSSNKLDDNEINKANWEEEVETETYRVLGNLISSPTSNGLSLIKPKKFNETLQVITECAQEIDNLTNKQGQQTSWCEDITPEYLLTGQAIEYIEVNMCQEMGKHNGAAAQAVFGKKIYSAIEDFRQANAAEISEVPVDNNKTIPMYNYNSVSLSIVLMHGLILASSELYTETSDEELSKTTKFILDAIAYELHTQISEDLADIGDYAPYKILSTFRMRFTPLISRSIVNLLKDRELTNAYAEIETIINQNIIKAHHEEEKDNLTEVMKNLNMEE